MISEDILCDMLFDSLNGTNSLNDFLYVSGILVNFIDMPGTVQGFIYISLKGEYHIVVNDSLSPEHKLKILVHELKHIFRDFPKLGFVIGLDFQHNKFEVEADIFSKKVVKMLKNEIKERRNIAIGR